MRLKLSSHLTTKTVSLSLSMLCVVEGKEEDWQYLIVDEIWPIGLIRIIFQWNPSFGLFLRCSSSSILVVNFGEKSSTCTLQSCVIIEVLLTYFTKSHIITSSFKYGIIGMLRSCFCLSLKTILTHMSPTFVYNNMVVWNVLVFL